MAANISSVLSDWSVTPGSNQPDGTDTADLDAEFQAIQAAVRKYVRAIGADIASGATVNLANATGEFVSVTGTTGISGFGTVGAGMRFIIRFVSALTITHNATSLICPAGADLVVNANDIIWLESLGSGNWRILSYMPVQATRTWQDVSGSRALDTEYTNTNSYPISVSVSLQNMGDGDTAQFNINNSVTVSVLQNPTGTGARNFGPFTVEPGDIYEINITGTATINAWSELR